MNIMQIRMATPDDAYAVASTLQKAFLEFEPLYTPEAFATTISSPDQIRLRLNEGPIWVAIQDDMVVGTVYGEAVSSPWASSEGHLKINQSSIGNNGELTASPYIRRKKRCQRLKQSLMI